MVGTTWIRIRNRGWHRTYRHRQELHTLGYMFDPKAKDWKKRADGISIEEAKALCRKYKFELFLDVPQYRRNSTYRNTYFDSHPGLFGRDLFLCSYCGMLFHKNQLHIDHIFSVRSIQRSSFLKWLLTKMGIDDVNDPKNLTAACARCNERKGEKGGLWILRGYIGQHPGFWAVYWAIVIIVVILALGLAVPQIINAYKFIQKML